MKFVATDLPGVVRVEVEQQSDERGFFARSFCREEFAAYGLDPAVEQCSLSFNSKRYTLRGMHYQKPPHEEAKLVRCVRGAIFDVAVDLRRDSATHRRWVGMELNDRTRAALYVPRGVAHGFLTLTENAEVFYQIAAPYHADCACGVRWNDRAFGIRWPREPAVISERDRSYPDYLA